MLATEVDLTLQYYRWDHLSPFQPPPRVKVLIFRSQNLAQYSYNAAKTNHQMFRMFPIVFDCFSNNLKFAAKVMRQKFSP